MRGRRLLTTAGPVGDLGSMHHAESSRVDAVQRDPPAVGVGGSRVAPLRAPAGTLVAVPRGQLAWAGRALLQLQRVYGNRYVQRVISHAQTTPVVQPKLVVGPAGDRYEREADRVAQQVVATTNAPGHAGPHPPDGSARSLSIQRMRGVAGGATGLGAHSQGTPGGGDADGRAQAQIRNARGGGQPLPENVRRPMEEALGADFSGVRVHTDSTADVLSRSVHARAFATGNDLFFRRGAYQPQTRTGQHVLAHELTHVMQQGGLAGAHPPGHAIQRYFEVTAGNFWDFVKGQERKQKLGRQEIDEKAMQQTIEPFTTVGFEAEFAQTTGKDNPLQGTSHLELTEAEKPEMSYTGLKFKLETDAANAIELVTPPFLLPTVLGKPIPDPVDVAKIDQMMRTALGNLASKSSDLGRLVEGFNKSGIEFELDDVVVEPHHLSFRNVGKFDQANNQIKGKDLGRLKVERSQKNGGITTQANIATDVDTFHKLGVANRPTKISNDGANLTAQFTHLQDQLQHLLTGYIASSRFSNLLVGRKIDIFTDLLARNLAGQFAIGPMGAIRGIQEKMFKDRSIQGDIIGLKRKKTKGGGWLRENKYFQFIFNALITSHVKDIDGVWLKDTFLNVVSALFRDNDNESRRQMIAIRLMFQEMLKKDSFRRDLTNHLSLLQVRAGQSSGLPLTKPRALALNQYMQNTLDDSIGKMIDVIKSLDAHLGALVKGQDPGPSGPASNQPVPFMTHNPGWVTPRQDTMVPHGKTQIPYWFDEKSTPLHVTELRRDAVGMLWKLVRKEAGARWKFVKQNASDLKGTTKIYARTSKGAVRYISFANLLKCWKLPFGEKFDIENKRFADYLSSDEVKWEVLPTEVKDEASIRGRKLEVT